jgi:hypothetical protein
VTYVRPSSLGVAEFCPRSADLSSQSGIGRSAVISSAWHAKLAGNDTLIGELHPDERKEVASWGTPTTAELLDSNTDEVSLDYDSAEKELHVQVIERDTLITEGTLDFAWVREVNGQRWAFVADLKRSTWAIPDGPDCLQLAAYGHAYAVLRSCVGYTPGLWSGTDSDWTWGTPVDLTSPEALDLWLRLKRAARNDWRLMPEGSDKARYTTGSHCTSCYGRQRCPEFTALCGDLTEPEPNEENAAGMLVRARALQDLADKLTENVKVFAQRGGVVKDPKTGKVFLPTVTKGRESLDKEALLKDYPDATKYWRRGKQGQQFGWRKP